MRNERSSIDADELIVYDEPDETGWNIELPVSMGGGFVTFETQEEQVFMFEQLRSLCQLEEALAAS